MAENVRRAAPIAGGALGAGFIGAASPVILGGVATIAASASQVLAAGGVLGIGVALAAQKPIVKDAAASLKETFAAAFDGLGDIMAPAVADALGIFQGLAEPIAGALRPVLESLEPAIRPLAQGLADLVQNSLPGFTELAASGAPFFEGLAPLLPEIGTALSGLAGSLADVQPLFQDLATGAIAGLPLVIEGVTFVIEKLTGAFDGFVAGLSGDTSASGWVGFFQDMGAGARDLYDRITELWSGPFGDQLRSAATEVGNFLASVSPTFALIKALVSGEGVDGEGLQSKLQPIITGVQSIITAVQEKIPVVLPVIQDITSKIVSAFRTVATDVKPIMDQVIAVIGTALELIGAIIGPVLTYLTTLWNKYGEDITRVVSGAYEIIKSVISGALSIIQGILDVFIGLFTGDWDRMGKGLQRIWEGLWTAVGGILRGAWQIISGIGNMVASSLRDAFTRARDTVSGIVSRLRDYVIDRFQAVVSWLSGLGGRISSAVGNIGSQVSGIGRAIIDGIKSGIVNSAGRLATAAKDAVSSALGAAKRLLGIRSPSAVFAAEVGRPIMQGVAVGIEGQTRSLARTTAEAMPAPTGLPASAPAPSATTHAVPTVRISVADSSVGRFLVELLRREVRVSGGNVQVVLGS